MRLIDADALIKQKEEYIRLLEAKINSEINATEKEILVHRIIKTLDMLEIIRTTPTFEPIRCENCKHYDGQVWDRKGRGRCKSQDIDMFPNDFCSYGERRDK